METLKKKFFSSKKVVTLLIATVVIIALLIVVTATGITRIECEDCHGSGELFHVCQECNGLGRLDYEDCADCEGEGEIEGVPCETCEGTGNPICETCGGTGTDTVCPTCGGEGKVFSSIWALLPPIIAIGLALITKEVFSSLFLGILSGGILAADFAPLKTLDNVVNVGLINAVSGTAGIFIFLIELGIIVALVNKSGGSQAFGE